MTNENAGWPAAGSAVLWRRRGGPPPLPATTETAGWPAAGAAVQLPDLAALLSSTALRPASSPTARRPAILAGQSTPAPAAPGAPSPRRLTALRPAAFPHRRPAVAAVLVLPGFAVPPRSPGGPLPPTHCRRTPAGVSGQGRCWTQMRRSLVPGAIGLTVPHRPGALGQRSCHADSLPHNPCRP